MRSIVNGRFMSVVFGYSPDPKVGLRPALASAEGFHGTLEGWERLLEIAGDHDWFTFNARVKRQKPWLDDFGELRSILHVYDQDSRPPSAIL